MPEPKKGAFLQNESRFEGKYAGSLANTIYQAYRPVFLRTIFLLIVGFAGRIFFLGNANLVGYWVDSLCSDPAECRPIPAIFSGLSSAGFVQLLILATLLGFVCTLIFRIGLSRLSAEAISRVYDETTLRTSRLPMAFFDRNPSGRIMTRFTSDYNNVFRIFGGPLAEFIGLVFDILAMTILITVASPWFLLFWLLQAGMNFGIYRWYLPSLRAERRETARKRSPSIAHFAESAHGAGTIRAYGRQGLFEGRFSFLNDIYLLQRLKTVSLFVRFSLCMNGVTAFTFLCTGLASVWLVQTGRLSIGDVGVAFAYIGLSGAILQSFFEWLGQFEDALSGLERMNEYLRHDLEPGQKLPAGAVFQTGHEKESAAQPVVKPWDGQVEGVSLEVDDLWMSYREGLPPVLQGIGFRLEAGEKLAIIGKTGSGKTSLIQALYRLYPLEKGKIRVGGIDLDEGKVDLQTYRSFFSYITQEATLFLGSLRENLVGPGAIAAGESAQYADEKLIAALREVQFLRADATNEEYAYWLDFQVEERGRNLSAGERQLLCMARCLLQDAPVVIFDEATSAVDPQSEKILQKATEEFFRHKTQIIIAHRLSTIQSCDRVLWLESGKIRTIGKPREVLQLFEQPKLS